MKNLPLNLLLAILAAVSLSSCKTKSKETWTTKRNPMEAKFAGNFKIAKDEFGNNRSVRTKADGETADTSDAFIGKREFDGKSTFTNGKRGVEKKTFDTGIFGGKKEFGRESYQFLKSRDSAQQESSMQNLKFADTGAAKESKKSWLNREKTVERTGFFANRKKDTVATGDYAPATKATESNRGGQKPIITPPGRETAPITLKDVKAMLGREY